MLLDIADNGIGFNVNLAEQLSAEKESTGFLNIKKRAKLINADVIINSEEGKGTIVKIKVPK